MAMLLSHILIGKDIGQTSTEYCKRRNSNGGHLSYASAEKRAIARYLYQICQGHTHFRIDFHHILWHYLIMGGSSGGLAYANVVPNLRAFGSHPRGRGFESLRLHHVITSHWRLCGAQPNERHPRITGMSFIICVGFPFAVPFHRPKVHQYYSMLF